MSWIQVIVLAVVQGVTEFLPISSSAHLILFSKWLGWPDQGLAFDIAVHAGSLLAVIAYLRRDLVHIARGLLPGRTGVGDPLARLAWPLLVATLPVAVTGLLLQDWVATGGRSPTVLAITSIVFGILLGVADRLGRRRRPLESSGWLDLLTMGLAQALAVVPGTSRSGVTMTAGLATGLTRTAAARLSFLLSVPVGLLVAAKDVIDIGRGVEVRLDHLAVGFVVAAIAAFVSIDALLRWLKRRGMAPFVAYRVLLGAVLLAEAIFWFGGNGGLVTAVSVVP